MFKPPFGFLPRIFMVLGRTDDLFTPYQLCDSQFISFGAESRIRTDDLLFTCLVGRQACPQC